MSSYRTYYLPRNRFGSRKGHNQDDNYGFSIRPSTESRESMPKPRHTPGEWLDSDSEPDYDRVQDHNHDHSHASRTRYHNTREQPCTDRGRRPANRYHSHYGQSNDESDHSLSTIDDGHNHDHKQSFGHRDKYQGAYGDPDEGSFSTYNVEAGMSEKDVQRYREKRRHGYHTHGRGYRLYLCELDCETYNERAQEMQNTDGMKKNKNKNQNIPLGGAGSKEQKEMDARSNDGHEKDCEEEDDRNGSGKKDEQQAFRPTHTGRKKSARKPVEVVEISDDLQEDPRMRVSPRNPRARMEEFDRPMGTTRCIDCGRIMNESGRIRSYNPRRDERYRDVY